MALTSQPQKAGFPLTLPLRHQNELMKSWVKISQIRTLSVARLGKKICRVTDDELKQVIEGLNEIIN